MSVKAGNFGTRLSMPQIVASMIPAWLTSGAASSDEMSTICAIAGAESDGYCQAVSAVASDGTQGFGLCQIESSHTEFGTFDTTNSNKWQNPVINMNMARAVFVKAGGKFDPWSTYGNGRYRMYLNQAQSAVTSFLTLNYGKTAQDQAAEALFQLAHVPEAQGLPGNGIDEILHFLNINTYDPNKIHLPNPVSALDSFFKDTSTFVGKLTKWQNWASIGFIVGGALLMVTAIARISHIGNKLVKAAPVVGALA